MSGSSRAASGAGWPAGEKSCPAPLRRVEAQADPRPDQPRIRTRRDGYRRPAVILPLVSASVVRLGPRAGAWPVRQQATTAYAAVAPGREDVARVVHKQHQGRFAPLRGGASAPALTRAVIRRSRPSSDRGTKVDHYRPQPPLSPSFDHARSRSIPLIHSAFLPLRTVGGSGRLGAVYGDRKRYSTRIPIPVELGVLNDLECRHGRLDRWRDPAGAEARRGDP